MDSVGSVNQDGVASETTETRQVSFEVASGSVGTDCSQTDKMPEELIKAETRLEKIDQKIVEQSRILDGTKANEKKIVLEQSLFALGKLKSVILSECIAIEENEERTATTSTK